MVKGSDTPAKIARPAGKSAPIPGEIKPKEGENMSYVICVKNGGTKKYEHFEVPEQVYLYILQLEAYIRHPKKSKLREFYSDLFPIKTKKETP